MTTQTQTRKQDVDPSRIDAAYQAYMQQHDADAYAAFQQFLPVAAYAGAAPPQAAAIARMVAVRTEDCGPCLQISVHYALAAQVPADHIHAVLEARPEALPPMWQRVYAYAEAVADHAPEANDLAEELADLLGHDALVALALAVATVRVFPTLKRGMGFARSCALVTVEVPA